MRKRCILEISFSEFRAKMVINLTDGRKLGHVIDLIFDQNSACITGIIVPGGKGGLFKSREDLFIPYRCICKIGYDTILVQLNPVTATNTNNQNQYVDAKSIPSNDAEDKKRKYVVYSPENY